MWRLRKQYRRESPRCPHAASERSKSIARTTTVARMSASPRPDGCFRTTASLAYFSAALIASALHSVFSRNQSRVSCTTSFEATSPPPWPPAPSARTQTPILGLDQKSQESSFTLRLPVFDSTAISSFISALPLLRGIFPFEFVDVLF